MAFLFIGAEDIDFIMPLGGWGIEFYGGFRGSFSRCAPFVRQVVSPYIDGANAVRAPFSAPSANFWMTAQIQMGGGEGSGRSFFYFSDGGVKRIAIGLNTNNTVCLMKFDDAGVATVLGTSVSPVPINVLARVDMKINYGVSGQIRVFYANQEIITYNGDLTSGSTTKLDQLSICSFRDVNFYFSEVVVAERDTRSLSLAVITPNSTPASGNQWVGTFDDINELIANRYDVVYSTAADQTASYGASNPPSGTFNVRALKVSALAVRGESGPQQLQLGVVPNGGLSAFGASQPLDTGWTQVGTVFESNPNTGLGWKSDDIRGCSLSLKSKA